MLKGKTALVTGSTSGIGLGIAKALARQGASIVLNGFGNVEGPKAQVESLGVKVAYHGADMSKPAEIEDMMKFAAAQFGRVDILVNNAGIQHVAPVEDFPARKMGRHHRDQSLQRVPCQPPGAARDEGGQLGTHHQRGVGARPGRLRAESRLTSRPSTAWSD